MITKIPLFIAILAMSGSLLAQTAPETARSVIDKKSELLADSKFKASGSDPAKPAQNMGCPAADEEVAAFIEVPKKTSKISDKDIPAITERFKKNRS